MMIELSLDLIDLENEIQEKQRKEKELKIEKEEKSKFYRELAHKYQERLNLTHEF